MCEGACTTPQCKQVTVVATNLPLPKLCHFTQAREMFLTAAELWNAPSHSSLLGEMGSHSHPVMSLENFHTEKTKATTVHLPHNTDATLAALTQTPLWRTLLEMGCGCYVLLTLSEDDAFLPCLWNQAMHLIHYDALLWAASEGSQDKVPVELPRFSIGTWWTQELNKHWFSPEAQACQHYSLSCPRRKALLQD